MQGTAAIVKDQEGPGETSNKKTIEQTQQQLIAVANGDAVVHDIIGEVSPLERYDDPTDELQKLHHSSDVYDFGKNLGKGSFGKVYEAVYRPTGEKIAVKVGIILMNNYGSNGLN